MFGVLQAAISKGLMCADVAIRDFQGSSSATVSVIGTTASLEDCLFKDNSVTSSTLTPGVVVSSGSRYEAATAVLFRNVTFDRNSYPTIASIYGADLFSDTSGLQFVEYEDLYAVEGNSGQPQAVPIYNAASMYTFASFSDPFITSAAEVRLRFPELP